MKWLKITFIIIFLLLAMERLIPIYLISNGLIFGENNNDTSYFVRKLLFNLGLFCVYILISWKLFLVFKNR